MKRAAVTGALAALFMLAAEGLVFSGGGGGHGFSFGAPDVPVAAVWPLSFVISTGVAVLRRRRQLTSDA